MVTSYNGWPASTDPDAIDIDKAFTAAGRRFPGGVKRGPVSVVFRYLVEQFDRRVEPVDLYDPGDEWGYSYRQNRNASNLSCHASGTAIDINATRHPNGRSGTFTPNQVKALRKLLAELDGVIRWGGDFSGTKDEMHFEVCGDAKAVAKVAGKLLTGTTPQPEPVEDDMPPSPAIVNVGGVDFTFVRGIDAALHVHDGVQWKQLGGELTSAPSATLAPDGMVHVAARGKDGATYVVVFNPANRSVGGWKNIGGKS